MTVTPEQARKALERRRMTHSPQKQPAAGVDVRGIAQQLAQGMLLSFSDEIIGAMAGVAEAAQGRSFGEGYTAARDSERDLQNEFREDSPGQALAANVLGGMLTGGAGFKAARALGASAGGAAATVPAVEGALSGAGASDAPLGPQTAIDAGQGAAFGAGAGFVGNQLVRSFGGRAAGDVMEAGADDLGRTAATRAKKLGVVLDLGEELADDARKSTATARNAAAIPRRIGARRAAKNQKAINRSILSRFGLKGDKVTGRALAQIEDKANQLYDDFANVVGNARFSRTNGFRENIAAATEALQAADMNPALKKEVQKVARLVIKGGGTPKQVKRRLMHLREMGRKARKANKPDIADGYEALQDALFGALDPGDSQQARSALEQASKFWRDFKLIDQENVLESVSGNINPGALSNALGRSKFSRQVFTRGSEADNPIFEIGRLMRQVGENPNSIVGKFRSSGTAERSILNQILGLTQAPGQLANSTQTGQRLATELGRPAVVSGARAAGASAGER
jgi:hypothetical protein